ncbi:hypothetical protein [Nocardia sp. BMG51109]|uniref:hypothetical protein n=1 Tax=Nocardia sp. BMG51109 TaxID=1056816 RepID=UPI00046530EC|nr:hypothetical protein [Nocardia sp. BMG51109]
MRFAKTGVAALAVAGAALGSGVAHADETIEVTAELLGCSVQNDVGVDVLANVEPGTSITVSNELAADLKAKGCLP